MTRVALAYGAGVALPLAGTPFLPALPLLLAAALILTWMRPASWFLSVALLAGLLAGEAGERSAHRDCRLGLPRSAAVEVTGRFLGRPVPGRSVPFRVESGLPGGCTGTVRAVWPSQEPPPPTGVLLHLPAQWEGRGFPEPGRGEWAGRLRLRPQAPGEAAAGGVAAGGHSRLHGDDGSPRLQGTALALRGRVLDRVGLLWPERAPMVEALVLARREHLDPELRAAFGLSGTAHLLAISGFHVGVVAGLLLGGLRMAGTPPRRSALLAALGAWGYVLSIGAPDAALRASVLLSLLAVARLRGRPTVSVGTLSTAFLALLVADPSALRSVGFQLSFAGTLGLVALRAPLEAWVDRGWRRAGRTPPRRRPGAGTGERWLRGSSEGLVAGVAATLPTLPLLAWHFDRVSVVGIPATLAVAPWVSLAIPGIGAALLSSLVSLPLGHFLAGGVDTLLLGVESIVLGTATLPGAAPWVSRDALLAASGAGGTVWLALRRARPGRVGPGVRLGVSTLAGGAGVLLVPLLPGPATLEVHLLDVGQGDAMALRLPDGGWILVDAGPRGAGWDAGERRVIPYLRREGVRRLEALVLSHPHLDHLGGAPAILQEFPVRGILDPSHPVPSRPYLEVLERALDAGVAWWPARAGQVLRRGRVEIRVLHPGEATRPGAGGEAASPGDGTLPPHLDANDLSVVLLVRFGEAHVLLTGDAYAWVEEALLPDLPPLTVLKVGHHGSRTSSSPSFLEAVRPDWALVPAGDGNRYGHPHPEVLERLEAVGSRILRSDRDGNVRLRIRPDGTVVFRTGR